jgi:membrane-associated phospholipid phosphatase
VVVTVPTTAIPRVRADETERPSGDVPPPRPGRLARVLVGVVGAVRPEECLFGIFAVALIVIVGVTGEFGIVDHRLFLAGLRFVGIVVGVATPIFVRGYVRAGRTEETILGLDRGRVAAGLRLAGRTTREFGPLFATLALYEALHDLTPVLRPHVEDHLLVASDHALFHVDVGVWLDSHIGSSAMTHILTYCYLSYAFASPTYAGYQYLRGRFRQFHDFALAITVTAFIGFSGYLLLPAVGPYVFQHALYPHPLPGWGHGGLLDIIAKLKGSARDAFPSLHTAMTTVVLGMMWRDARKLFWAYLPVALGLYLSTMYLRVHYATDVLAGFVVGAVALYSAPKINIWWYGRRRKARAATVVPRPRQPVEAPAIAG